MVTCGIIANLINTLYTNLFSSNVKYFYFNLYECPNVREKIERHREISDSEK